MKYSLPKQAFYIFFGIFLVMQSCKKNETSTNESSLITNTDTQNTSVNLCVTNRNLNSDFFSYYYDDKKRVSVMSISQTPTVYSATSNETVEGIFFTYDETNIMTNAVYGTGTIAGKGIKVQKDLALQLNEKKQIIYLELKGKTSAAYDLNGNVVSVTQVGGGRYALDKFLYTYNQDGSIASSIYKGYDSSGQLQNSVSITFEYYTDVYNPMKNLNVSAKAFLFYSV